GEQCGDPGRVLGCQVDPLVAGRAGQPGPARRDHLHPGGAGPVPHVRAEESARAYDQDTHAVVVVFSGTLARSSTPPLAAVSNASVVSGVISETDPTKVVLPTPKPPATTILTGVITGS